ncbi:acetyl-CoA carboxylase biotin carboxyl carrier protein [Ammoniphilus sp. CFH 90114]|uniref:acetyl-CoA carboxylase biotin carboxyl carrier protein n=1 Tax=Ammoniphilus sp. CFH 90114 TaxID=2493665 RepID=UPI00101006A1|nr:acetyl-CoA carboxylase biotin carboxyl carrier protein [Ammoniphilus sp. CFH 90114]RXT04191.1 acetyl-CoA carboxylase biotin carboxyl carrier protein [Ammoniphilus sp. CFH 90114]
MLKMYEIRELFKLVDQSSLQEFEYKAEDTRLRFKKAVPTQVNSDMTTHQQVLPTAPAPSVVPPISQTPKTSQPPVVTKNEIMEATPNQPKPKAEETLQKIVSPMVGTFYRAPSTDAAPYVQPGVKVEKTTVVCILEAMKLFNEIEADMSGEIVEVLVENGQFVELGQPLFTVRTIGL